MPTSSSRRAASASRTPSRTLGAPGLPAQHEAAGATLATETQAHASDVAVAPTLSARKPRLQALLASKKLVVGPEDGEGAPVQAPPGVPQAAPLAATAMAAADSVAAGLAAAASAHSTSTLVTIARIKPNRSATGLQVTIEPPAVPGGKTTLNLTATDDGSGAAGSAHGAPASKRGECYGNSGLLLHEKFKRLLLGGGLPSLLPALPKLPPQPPLSLCLPYPLIFMQPC